MNRIRLGRWGEEIAESYLREKGLSILDRNWRSNMGEIDLVAREGETIVFVEVKTRAGLDFGFPEEAITANKRRRLRKLAWQYLEARKLMEAEWRIDVVAIEGEPKRGVRRIEHLESAVGFERGR